MPNSLHLILANTVAKESFKISPIMESTGVEKARDYLRAVSQREASLGVPVGCILMKKSNAGLLKKSWHAAKLGRIGIKHFQDIDGSPDYAILHMATHTAANIALLQQRGEDQRVAEVLSVLDGEYFHGVRVNDSYFQTLAKSEQSCDSAFTFGEIFAGIGGFRLGLEPLGGKCVFASEIDGEAEKTYAENFGSADLIGDITGHYAQDLPQHDILTGGFPCQSFSVRGDQKGLNDPRGQLYQELVRVLIASQPKSFIFENVANLVVHDGGKRGNRCLPPEPDVMGATLAMILNDFKNTGYQVAWKIVNSRHWLPQNRERVYIIGFRNDLGINPSEVFDWNLNRQASMYNTGKGKGLSSTVRDILEPSDAADIPLCVLTRSQLDKITSIDFLKKSYPLEAKNNTLTGKENWINIDGKSPTLVSGYRNTSSFSTKYVFHEPDGTLREMPRFFTHLECKRIMGFPDSFKIPDAVKYTTFYKQIGNAVCPPVIHAIGAEVLRILGVATSVTGTAAASREESLASTTVPAKRPLIADDKSVGNDPTKRLCPVKEVDSLSN